jgi:hypothetical protein
MKANVAAFLRDDVLTADVQAVGIHNEACTDCYDADAFMQDSASNNYCIPADGIIDFSDIDIHDSYTTPIDDNSADSECSNLI